MLTAALRRSGGSLIVTVPQSFVEQNQLQAGSPLAVEIHGNELRLRPGRVRPSLDELLSATPRAPRRVKGWDELAPVGTEL
jgi:antitoxin ChpS